ncbi:MAG: formate dehydrogenase accessory sulfurtransferase FdhD, partial [Gemmatimonadaceae bacterium]|nr:formate dehydrogenase accessory sulfurtransferase FdhD [Gemmatimonadaceae bacterium]
ETPVTIAYNLASHAVMMATPGDLEDFAVGFTLTEGIVSNASDIVGVSVVRHAGGVELQIDIAEAAAVAASGRSRRLSGRTGCGICGTADVERVLRDVPAVAGGSRFTSSAVLLAMDALATRQPLHLATGAVHAAGWARADGTLVHVREDVGRHNALDKLVGAMVRSGDDASGGFVVMTSRGSFELVQKAALLGVSLLAVVSAPTALAIRVAEAAGLTLIGFARAERLTVYTHASTLVASCQRSSG